MDTQQRKTRNMQNESKRPSPYHFAFNKDKVIKKRYKIVKKIGEGGFGTVFEAFDSTLNKSIALKFFYPEIIRDKINLIRIKREINISQKISDERIVKLFSLEKWRDTYFLVMELIAGQTLKKYLSDKGRVKWKDFEGIFFQIINGLNALHKKGIIHRDIKPSNIMLTKKEQIKVLDFGLSKELSDTEKTSVTGVIMGSPQYMSPEQIQGRDLDFRSDIYQLGLLLYYSLSGVHPFESSTSTIDMMIKQLNEEPEKFSTHGVKVPNYVEFAIQKSLKKKKKQRFQSIDEIITLFKKGKISFWAKLKSRVMCSPLRFAIPIFLILLSLFSVYFITSASRVFDSFKIEETKILAKNKFGFKIWEKDFTPFYVSNMSDIGVYSKKQYSEYLKSTISTQPKLFFLKNPENKKFSIDSSICSEDCDNRIALISRKGNVLSNFYISGRFLIESYDFAKTFYLTHFERIDLTGDNHPESLVLGINHSNGMYPYAFIIYKSNGFCGFINPGYISKYGFLKSEQATISCYFFGNNNIMAHSLFFAEVPLNGTIYSIPNLNTQIEYNINSFMVFLPREISISEDYWKQRGEIHFFNKRTLEDIYLNKDYTLRVKSKKGERIYKDNPSDLKNVYFLINQYYQEKNLHKNPDKAYSTITKCLSFHIENPYLRSVLLYFKGDLEVLNGNYKKGEKTLRKALELHPQNPDASQRLVEILFLKNQFTKALEKIDNEYDSLPSFWGLFFGKELFKMYIHLQMGNYYLADAQLSKIYNKKFKQIIIFKSICDLFKGNYEGAEKNLKESKYLYLSLFSIQEFRLFWARAMVLSNKNLKRAEFYFTNIGKFSYTMNHLTDMSVSYFLAKKGEKGEAKKLATKTFNTLLKLSKGNFETRLWLFYDAYIYAKTMEILENKTEAIRGYKTCIKANPYTDLAKKARKALESK